jgi:hypothetical protein
MDIEKLRKQADWRLLEKRCPWTTLTSIELSKVLGVTIVDVNNWNIRGHLPEPEPRRKGKGNKNRWKISVIRSWLESRPEDDIHWEFINSHMAEGFQSIEQAKENAKKHWRAFDIEKM